MLSCFCLSLLLSCVSSFLSLSASCALSRPLLKPCLGTLLSSARSILTHRFCLSWYSLHGDRVLAGDTHPRSLQVPRDPPGSGTEVPEEQLMLPMLSELQLLLRPPLPIPSVVPLLLTLTLRLSPPNVPKIPTEPVLPRVVKGGLCGWMLDRFAVLIGGLVVCGGPGGILMASSESERHSEEEEDESVSTNSRDLGVILLHGPLCFLLSWFRLTECVCIGICWSVAGDLLLELVALRGSFLGAVFTLGGLICGLGMF